MEEGLCGRRDDVHLVNFQTVQSEANPACPFGIHRNFSRGGMLRKPNNLRPRWVSSLLWSWWHPRVDLWDLVTVALFSCHSRWFFCKLEGVESSNECLNLRLPKMVLKKKKKTKNRGFSITNHPQICFFSIPWETSNSLNLEIWCRYSDKGNPNPTSLGRSSSWVYTREFCGRRKRCEVFGSVATGELRGLNWTTGMKIGNAYSGLQTSIFLAATQ